jgi:CBS domain-containing protein
MKVSEIMSQLVHTIRAEATLEQASRLLRDEDIGCLPAVEEALGELTKQSYQIAQDFRLPPRRAKGRIARLCNPLRNTGGGRKDKQAGNFVERNRLSERGASEMGCPREDPVCARRRGRSRRGSARGSGYRRARNRVGNGPKDHASFGDHESRFHLLSRGRWRLPSCGRDGTEKGAKTVRVG